MTGTPVRTVVLARPVVEGTVLAALVVRGVVLTTVVAGVGVVATGPLNGTVDVVACGDEDPHAAANTTAMAPIAHKRPS
ncbi:MAG: hypothetical protein ACLPVY_07300 [Acidimicrobiia bacterium]